MIELNGSTLEKRRKQPAETTGCESQQGDLGGCQVAENGQVSITQKGEEHKTCGDKAAYNKGNQFDKVVFTR